MARQEKLKTQKFFSAIWLSLSPHCALCVTHCTNLPAGRNTCSTIRCNILLASVSSVQFSHSVVSDSLRPHGLQHARPPYPSPTPGVYQTRVHWVGDAVQPSMYSCTSLSKTTPPRWHSFLTLQGSHDPPPCTCRPGLCKLSITHYLMCSLPTQKTCITLLWPLTGGTVLRAFWDALPELNPQFGSNKIFPFFLINFSLTLFDQSVCMLSCSTVCNSFRPHGL